MSLRTPRLPAVGGTTAIAVGSVYRNPDSIDNCNRGRISCPGLDLRPSTGRDRQRVGGKGSLPPIALGLQSNCVQIAVLAGLSGGVAGCRTVCGHWQHVFRAICREASVRRRMRKALQKFLREQEERESRLQEAKRDLRREVEALWAEVGALRERVEAVEVQAARG